MTKDPKTVGPDAPVKDAAKVMVDSHIGALPVVDGGRVIGMVTEGDLIMEDVRIHFPTYIQLLDGIIYLESRKRFEEELKKAVGATVRDVMTSKVVAAAADDSIEDVATRMVDEGVSRLPVMEGDRLIGIITKGDIVRALSRS